MDNTHPTHVSVQTRNRKKTAQSNHDSFSIPQSLRQYADEPLYILIALWAQQQNRWICRTDISEVFEITPQRASFQVSYISKKKHLVTCQERAVRNEGSPNPHTEIWVTDVVLSRDRVRTTPSQPKTKPVRRSSIGNATPELRNLFNTLIGSRKTCSN